MNPVRRTINDIPVISGKRVLLRLSLNVPIKDGQVADDFRIEKSLPTLQTLVDKGAKVTVISHLGSDGGASLAPIESYLRAHIKGDFKVLPNLRVDPHEKLGDESLARELTHDQDIFVNEDFAASHRQHVSIVGVPKFLPSYMGLQFAQEIDHLSRALNPKSPCVVILGGAKLDTKIPMIKAFLDKSEKIFLGSYFLTEKDKLVGHPKVILPVDTREVDGRPMDIGPMALEEIERAIRSAATIIWNGPMGKFEDGYDQATLELARTIANTSAQSYVGGGDSISAIRKLNLLDKFTFVSTGGGAMLDFLAHGTLPGIEAILKSKLT